MTHPSDLSHTIARAHDCLSRLAAEFPQLRKMPDFREVVLAVFIARAECADLTERPLE